jgi:transcriptional regulator with XRE-family HTH domain
MQRGGRVPAVEIPTVTDCAWIDRVADATGDDAGPTLREWRRSTKTSQVEAARRLGMTQQNLSQIETGRHPMSHELRRRAVDELGIEPSDLGLSAGRYQAPDYDQPDEVRESQARWRFERRWLNQHRSRLATLAAALYPPEHRLPGTPLIASPEWMPDKPVDLRSVGLTLDEHPQPVTVDGSEPETIPNRPLCKPQTRFPSYTAAVKHVDPPRLFESRPSYRLLTADLSGRRMDFGLAAYFDKLDVSEAVGHELAAACLAHGAEPPPTADALRDALPFRGLIGDPFDLTRRAVIPAITTLTIRLRRYPAEPSFLLHWRDPAKVATAGGMYDVIPAGEFQPASVALWDRRNDFDLWRNIVREYSEELLGTPEHDGTRSRPLDYDGWPLYRELDEACGSGALTSFVLGVGLDALTLAATILTVVVIDDDVFVRQFGGAGRLNEEGEMVGTGGGEPVEGLPFTDAVVQRLLTSEPMASPGAACLALAWQHRGTILGQ